MRHVTRLLSVLLCAAVLAGCDRSSSIKVSTAAGGTSSDTSIAAQTASGMRFTDVTAAAGIDFACKNGQEAELFTILESLGNGVAVIDFDRDGNLDLFFAGGGTFADHNQISGLPSVLYQGLGGFSYANVSVQAAGGFPARRYNHGAFAADYDNDGFADVLLTGYRGLQLWRNQGDGTFASSSVLDQDNLWSSAAAWADFDGDGFLDLYVAHYTNWSFDNHPFCPGPNPGQRDICPPRSFEPLPDALYMSNGDGTFRFAGREAGLRLDGKGLGVLAADMDDDGDIDVYVANDTTDNFLYFNDGHGRFEELGIQRGVAVDDTGIPNGSMGLDLCDFNNDGRHDIWVANYEREDFALYRNEGSGSFLHVSRLSGLAVLGGLFVGFGTSCADFDRDGDEDIVVANGHVIRFPVASPRQQLPLLLENNGGRFTRQRTEGSDYFAVPHEGRGLAAGDLDRDGDLDLAMAHINQPVTVLRNDSPPQGDWLQVQLVGVQSNRDAVGATLALHTSRGTYVRKTKGGGSYLSTSEPSVFWGLPPGTKMERLEVRWPSGRTSAMTSPAANQRLQIIEPPPS